jgi:hypothetical protein
VAIGGSGGNGEGRVVDAVLARVVAHRASIRSAWGRRRAGVRWVARLSPSPSARAVQCRASDRGALAV